MNFKKQCINLMVILVIALSLSIFIYIISLAKSVKIHPFHGNQLKNVIFRTDGVITAKWISRCLKIPKNTNLFEIDINRLINRINQFSQIKNVIVEKRYPDILFVELIERKPLLKFIAHVDGKSELFLIDKEDGEIFSPICYEDQDLMKILYVDLNVTKNPKFSGEFLPFIGISIIKTLINLLDTNFPEIFSLIKFIDLKNFDHRKNAVWSRIVLHLKNEIVIILGTHDFNTQLLRLEFLINQKYANRMNEIKKIDTSNPQNIIVKFK